MQATPRTLEDLGYADVLRALAQRCRTPMGQERALARPFLDTREAVTEALALVDEARRLGQEQVSLPYGGSVDLRDAVARAQKGGTLEPRELIQAAQLLLAMSRTRDVLEEREELGPRLAAIARRMPELERLALRIDKCFTPDGELADDASPELREARDRTRGLHRSIRARLDTLLHDEGFIPNLRENYYSVRNGRYVVPVVSNFRQQVPGIVHNASQTGQTLFVEPEAMVGMGNDLAIAQSVVAEEERRVLAELSGLLGREADRVLEGVRALAELDEAEAAAILSADLRAWAPELTDGGGFELVRLRHPRLALQGGDVVPNDVSLSGEARALVISGPNAGGKTVTLTAVGLCALMVRAGLPIPAGEGSRMPLYRSVHSTIGDAQDLSQGLSTFSAHVVVLRDILAQAGDASLVMIDEIAADTDPREGAAIAIAVLEDLLQKGATTLVTTHLEELKALAHMDPRFLNARVGFDTKRMAPTYKLQLGMAGASSAIEVAARVGLPAHLCARARELSMNAGGPLARALNAAEEDRRQLQEQLERAKAAAEEAEVLRGKLEAERAVFQRERRERELRFNQDVAAATEQAEAEVRELLKALRQQREEKAASEARVQLAQRAEDARKRAATLKAELGKAEAPTPARLEVGAWVHHTGLARDVEVLELDGDQALVAAGALKMRVPVGELAGSRKAKPAQKFPERDKQAAQLRKATQAAAAEVKATGFRVDVRGMRADEALTEIETFFDRGMRQGEDGALIVHGHGTGALKQAVRDFLAGSPYVRMYRPGESHEGGDGVTVVAFRS